MNVSDVLEAEEICSMADCSGSEPGNGSCKDNCSRYQISRKQEIRVYGLEDPCSVLDENKRELLRALARGRKLNETGFKFEYYALPSNPGAFVCEACLLSYLDEMDAEKFPVTVIDGTVLKTGAFPTDSELEEWTGLTFSAFDLEKEIEIQAVSNCEEMRATLCTKAESCQGAHDCFLFGGSSPDGFDCDDKLF